MKQRIEKIEKFERDMLCGKKFYMNFKTGDTSYKLHWHDYYEIIYYKNCHGVCTLNGKDYPVSESCIFFLTPKDFHKIENDQNKNQSSVNLSFSEQIIDRQILKQISECARVIYNPEKELTNRFEEFVEMKNRNDFITEFKTSHLLNLILADIITYGTCISSISKYISPAIGNAISYMISNKDKNFSLESVAKKSGLSLAYFSDLFHKETGITFIGFSNEIKIEQAKRLLEESDLSILDICFESGFNSISHFIRTFNKHTGVSPSKYRKQYR